MRRHLNYANVVATFALLFAMSGGALAAKHYLINSTSQINPKVLKKLKGNAGPQGTAGAAGAPGAAGKEGQQGKEGKEGKEGQQGKEGPAGSALAYAYVLANGELEAASSKNISSTSVFKPGNGTYCFKKLGFTPHNLVADIDWSTTQNGVIETVSVALGAHAQSLCGSPEAEAGVITGSVETGVFTKGINRAIYVTFN